MRVLGNSIPQSVEIYLRGKNAEVRLRENPHKIDYELYEYDEYTLTVHDRPGLEQEISSNLSEWLKTARSMEYNPGASEALVEQNNSFGTIGINPEAAFVATRDYFVGEFLSVYGKPYEVISPIPDGCSITVGQNVIETTVEHYLDTLKEEK